MADPDSFRVAPSLGGTPRVLDQQIENSAPMQLQRMGGALQQAGQQAGSIFEDMLREANAARVTDALAQATAERNLLTYDPDYGWSNITGGNAVNRPDGQLLSDEFGSQFDNKIENLATQLGNEAQRRAFRERATAMSLDFRARIDAHLATESRRYAEETYAGAIQTFQSQLGQARTPEELEEALSGIDRMSGQLFGLRGTPEEARAATLQELMTPGLLAQIQRRMDAEDIEGAESFFNQYRDDLTVEAASRAEGQLIEQRTLRDGYNIGEAAVGLVAADNAASAPQPIGMPFLGQFQRTGGYGDDRGDHRHGGIDYAMPVGTPVRAGAAGTVRVRNDPDGYGRYVDLKLDDGRTLRMAHLSAADVADGARVNAGDVIGRSGNSGRSTGPHLHYEVLNADGTKVDPEEFHQGRPVTQGGGSNATWQQVVENITTRGLSPRMEQAALERARTIWTARQETQQQAEEDLINSAYAEIDRNGSLSQATRARIASAGQGSSLPSLRSFEEATQARRSGVTLDPAMATEAYGRARIAIARGEITTADQLMRFNPYLAPAQMRSLFDDMSGNPQGARERAAAAIREVDAAIEGTGLFQNSQGRRTAEHQREYDRFVGAVVSNLESRDLTGSTQSNETDRQVVLGLLRQSSMGIRNYEVREMFDQIPRSFALQRQRALQRAGQTATVVQVVQDWQRLSEAERARYNGSR